MNSYGKFGGAARRHFSAICEKPMVGGGGHICAPGRARVNPRQWRGGGVMQLPMSFSELDAKPFGVSC